jgi:hypothetical protein
MLCEDQEDKHKVQLFHTEVYWLLKGNVLGRLCAEARNTHIPGMWEKRTTA